MRKIGDRKAFAAIVTPPSNPTICATTGDDGTTNINGSINTYFPPQGSIILSAGTGSIALGPVPAIDAYGNNFGTVPIKSGDLLLIIQMQDAAINYSNSTLYGANNASSGADGLGGTGFTDLGNSGKFEYVIATNNVPLAGGTLTFKGSGAANGTVYTYVNAAPTSTMGKRSFQILRLPQYSNLKLSSDISPPPFNGIAGGIIAFNVGGNIDFNGHTINVSGRGFRGGYSLVKTSVANISDLYVAQAADDRVSGKGEGIAGTPRYVWDGYNAIDNTIEGLPGGSGGRGAPANAGGGGNDSNSGGGGGANGGSGGNGGLGYQPIGGSTEPNGGRPGSITYSGSADVTRLVMGGGGGGGHANDALTGVKGGVGGGVVLIEAQSVTGNGTILANGGDGAPGTYGGHPDGSGGGGSGGTVLVKLSNPNPSAVLTIHAIGGKGGNTQNDDPGSDGVQPHGPGGGGGGGLISYAILSGTVNVDVSGGKSGKTNSGNGITHDAADGKPGVTNKFTIASLPPYLQGSSGTCYPILVTTMKVTEPDYVNFPGDAFHYVITIKNTASAGNAGGVQAYASLPSGISYLAASVFYTGAANGPITLVNQGTANAPIFGDFNIPAGETVTIDLAAQVSCMPSGTYNANAEAVYLDPTRLSTDPNRRITAGVNAFSGSNTTYQAGPSGPVPGSNYNGLSSTAEDVIVDGSNVSTNTITAPAITAFCASGNPAVFVGSTPTGGTGTYIYQWQISADNTTFTDIAGATAKDYQTSVINTTTYYRREVTSGSCNTPSISNVVQITILPVMTNNTITAPAVTSLCTNGDPSAITGSTPTGGSGTYGYQWQSSADNTTFTDITGATGRDYDPAAINSTTYYRRLVTSGTCNTPLISNAVTITVITNVVPVVNNVITPPSVTTFCASAAPTAITGNVPTGGTGSYVYQWQSSSDNTTFTDIAGATAKDYTPAAINATTYYRRGVTSGSCATPLMSNAVQITVQSAVANNAVTAPSVTSFCNTGDPSVITGSLPTGGDGTYTYQWQSSVDNVTFNNITGATAQNYDPSVITVTTYYRRIVASVLCNTPLASNAIAMVIQLSPAAPVAAASPVLVCAGNAATLAVASPQSGLTYNWYSSPSRTTILFTGDTYLTNPVNVNTTYYIEAVSSSCSSLSLASVQVNVTSAPVAPLVVNSQVPTCSGSMATLSVSNPQASLTYNWYTTASGGSAVYTGIDFVTPAITSNITYYAEAANNGGCTSVSRTAVNVTVNPLPQLTVQGASVCPGSNATLTATASNSTVNWYANAAGGSIIYTGTSYTVIVNANANYYVEAVDNSTGCVSAARALVPARLLQQLPAPVVSKQSSTISSITFQWDAVDGATGYQVSIDNGQSFTDPSSGTDGLTHTITGLQPNEAVTIIVRAMGAESCQLSTSSTAFTAGAVSALGDKIFVANAFTPNGDGENDQVYVHSDNIKSLKFYVYDQWGELIYTSLRQEDGWDGTYKGTKEPVGVYVYYLEAIMYGGEQVNKKGTITLLR